MKTEYAQYLANINEKYQAAIPAIKRWAYSLTCQQLLDETRKHGVQHISDLIHVKAKRAAMA